MSTVKPEDRGLTDSGTRANFAGGAVRDMSSGKGRYDLMPVYAWNLLAETIVDDPIFADGDLDDMWEMARFNMAMVFQENSSVEHAVAAMREIASFIQVKYWRDNGIKPTDSQQVLMPSHAVFRVARVYEKGAQKYAARNWEKGINLARFLDSAQRHWYQVLEGKDDEDHAGQALWNVIGWLQTKFWIDNEILPKSFDDMPVYKRLEEKTVQERGVPLA